MKYVMPEPNNELVNKAISVYREVMQFQHRMFFKWESRGEELRALDEFHRTRVAHENDMYWTRALFDETENLLLGAIANKHIFPREPFHKQRIKKHRNKDFQKLVVKVDALRKEIGECSCWLCKRGD